MVIWHGVRRARSLTITITSSVTIYKTPYKQDSLCGSLFLAMSAGLAVTLG